MPTSVAGSPEHAALFDLPRLGPPIRPRPDWCAPSTGPRQPEPLIPLYLRRPDAKTAERAGGAPVTVEYDALASADADGCAELEAQLFPGDDPWPAAAFLRELESEHNHYVAARVDGA